MCQTQTFNVTTQVHTFYHLNCSNGIIEQDHQTNANGQRKATVVKLVMLT